MLSALDAGPLRYASKSRISNSRSGVTGDITSDRSGADRADAIRAILGMAAQTLLVYGLIFYAMPAVHLWPARWLLAVSAPLHHLQNRATFR